MPKSFNRTCSLIVHDKKIQGLDFDFRVDRSLKPAQNTAEFTIYNLSSDNRKHIQSQKEVVVEFHAGYLGPSPISPALSASLGAIGVGDSEPPLIFLGSLRQVKNMREGPDWITVVTSGDGDEQRKSPVSFSLGPGASFQTAVKKVVESMGVGLGNTIQAISQGKLAEAGNQFIEGLTIHGNSGEELRKMLQSAGLEYSIQSGDIQVLPIGKALNTTAVLLKPATGLIGSPEPGEKGSVKFRSLLNAEIYPGRKIKIESGAIDGFFRVERAVYLGQLRGNDWYVDGEAKPL